MEFEELCRREYPLVYRAAFVFAGGDEQLALDATQEAFASPFARWGRLRIHEWAGGWVTSPMQVR